MRVPFLSLQGEASKVAPFHLGTLNRRLETSYSIPRPLFSGQATEVVIDGVKQEIRFAGQAVPATILVNGRWDTIGELLDGVPAVKEPAKNCLI